MFEVSRTRHSGSQSPCQPMPLQSVLPIRLCQFSPGRVIKTSISIVVVSGLSCHVMRHRGGLWGSAARLMCVCRSITSALPDMLQMSSKSNMRKRMMLTHIPEISCHANAHVDVCCCVPTADDFLFTSYPVIPV